MLGEFGGHDRLGFRRCVLGAGLEEHEELLAAALGLVQELGGVDAALDQEGERLQELRVFLLDVVRRDDDVRRQRLCLGRPA